MEEQPGTEVIVDLSLFTADNAFGRVSGTMRLPSMPDVGEAISFSHPDRGGSADLIGTVRVETILQTDKAAPALVMLSDVTVATRAEAFQVCRFLENGFGLFAEIHDEEDLRAYLEQDQGR